jgi:putative sterol carrier protein
MTETARNILARVAARGPDAGLERLSGSYRFDVEGAGVWRVALDHGTVTVTESAAPADCTIRCGEADFVRIASGEQNLLTAAMQGRVQVEGSMVLAQKLAGVVGTRRSPG